MNARRIVRIMVPLLVLASMAFFFNRSGRYNYHGGSVRQISYSAFLQAIDDNNVQDGTFDRQNFRGHFTRGGAAFTVSLPPESSQEYTLLIARLQTHGVRFGFQKPMLSDKPAAMVISVILPLIVIFFFWMFFLRQAQRNGTGRL